ncbi:unnamed protein product [Prorocentrum cordatum]|uniref:Cellulase n=1 Tax=Prorocentrum cordatum TaxID=2364126 RepID=A0ABN9Q365_9DINO|nr:unnamed protein product [Polarella glacialis]
MRADRSPFLPLQLPLESDCEPGEVAPARALRAPRAQRARAAAAALSAAAAALALLAMAWRAGPSTGAATLASPEAIIVEAASADANESADPDESDPCSQTGASCAVSKCCSEPGSKCYKKNDYWFACNQTCNPYYMWKDGGWVKTNETVWDCEDLTVSPVESADPIADAEAEDEKGTCSQTGASCAVSKCCSEPGSKCYKKNDYWFACNQTCNPYYMWKDGGWVKTNETVWDCEEIRPPCTPNGESCALSKCCSEPGMKCYKKNDYWSSCNQTCNPNYLWMETGWVKTDDTHWDCEVITIDSTDVSTDSDAGNAADAVASTDSECSPNGESCAQTMCCSEPGAKCYKKNDHWSSCNQTCDPFSVWEVDRWVVTNETVWDCEDLTVSPVESADPIADAEAEDEKGTCSQDGASCALSQCCSEPGSKCYKKNDHWSSCNQTCNPYYMWKDGGWVETNETVWDCEEVRPPCTPNGESCALSKCLLLRS